MIQHKLLPITYFRKQLFHVFSKRCCSQTKNQPVCRRDNSIPNLNKEIHFPLRNSINMNHNRYRNRCSVAKQVKLADLGSVEGSGHERTILPACCVVHGCGSEQDRNELVLP